MPASNSRGEAPIEGTVEGAVEGTAEGPIEGTAQQPADVLRTTAWALASGRVGHTVRCTPRRRTVMGTVMGEDDGGLVFAKVRRRRRRGAAAEVRWVDELPGLRLGA